MCYHPARMGWSTRRSSLKTRRLGATPPHFNDQQHLYTDLVYASPTLTPAQVDIYFKDATFGVRSGDVAATETPRSDVTIVREGSYGVPHI